MEWESVLKYNVSKAMGSWENNAINYNSGWRLGRKLFLPAAGLRYYGDGALNARGSTGYYWTSTAMGVDNAWFLGLTSEDASLNSSYRAGGRSIRCIAE
jgi:hypothetical protein